MVRLFGSAAALKILEEVRELGFEVGEILYNTVMEACGAAGQTKMSLSLLEVRVVVVVVVMVRFNIGDGGVGSVLVVGGSNRAKIIKAHLLFFF